MKHVAIERGATCTLNSEFLNGQNLSRHRAQQLVDPHETRTLSP